MNTKAIVVLTALGLGLGVWYAVSKKSAGAAVETAASSLLDERVPASAQEARTIAAGVEQKLDEVAKAYPDDPALANHLAQASASATLTLQTGSSLGEDPGARIFAEQLLAYQQYRAAGGTKDFETLTLYSDWRNWQLQLIQKPLAASPGTGKTYDEVAAALQPGQVVVYSPDDGGHKAVDYSDFYNPAYL